VDVGKVFDHMTWGSCNLTNPVRSGDDCFSLTYNIGTQNILIQIRPIWHIWLVKVMICRVGNF